jgi:DNA-binding protein HU-beta
MSNYTRKDLVAAIATKHGLSTAAAERIVLDLWAEVTKALKKGHIVTMSPFGTFTVIKRAARKGRNPTTGTSINIPATKSVRFKPYAGVKGAIS